jgi:hypothetical protein
MARIAQGCAEADAKRVTIVVATFIDDHRSMVLAPEIVRDAFCAMPRNGFRPADVTGSPI